MAFKKGDSLTEFDGKVFDDKKEIAKIYPQTHYTQCDLLHVAGLTDPDKDRGMGSFANHSLQPNAKTVLSHCQRRVLLRATKDIVPGEEVTICYGSDRSDAFRIAMGRMRVVVTQSPSGTFHFKHVPLLVEGVTSTYSVPGGGEPLAVIGEQLNLVCISPSPQSQGCFFRALAISLDDLLRCRRPCSVYDWRKSARAFLVDVDVESLREGGDDARGTTRMRSRVAEFLESLTDVWDNIYDPGESGDAITLGATIIANGNDDLPELEQDVEKELKSEIDSSRLGADSTPEDSQTRRSAIVRAILSKSIRGRSSDMGQLSMLLVSLMFGVNVEVIRAELVLEERRKQLSLTRKRWSVTSHLRTPCREYYPSRRTELERLNTLPTNPVSSVPGTWQRNGARICKLCTANPSCTREASIRANDRRFALVSDGIIM